ncbi:hypothetical protein SLEP1_g50346 [Rubroshorea leprosula]|uniref:Uncharacterized protein n=1 Tax=Rubroshorea leprosula TaxID=152421 RepID=A0AAV5M1R8_9ROSI|nr:hypothetical protein SLEP1_g50346 [Rubroshorea leprosula]
MKQATRGWGDMGNTRNRNKSCQSHKEQLWGYALNPTQDELAKNGMDLKTSTTNFELYQRRISIQ